MLGFGYNDELRCSGYPLKKLSNLKKFMTDSFKPLASVLSGYCFSGLSWRCRVVKGGLIAMKLAADTFEGFLAEF